MSTATNILHAVRTMGVEEMWETNRDPALSGIESLARCLQAQSEVGYPTGAYSDRCDLVIPSEAGDTWVECKFAWTYKVDRKPAERNGAYKKHLLTDPKESAMKDVTEKLPTSLNQPDVHHIGFLLVAFHSVQLPIRDADIAELEAEGGLNEGPWQRHVEPDWVNPRNPECRIRAYYWERPCPTV